MIPSQSVDANQQPDRANRDSKGRFGAGNNANPAGQGAAKRSLTQALRDIADPDMLARRLLARAKRSDTVLTYVFNRLEGMPRQALEHSGPDEGPIRMLLNGRPAEEPEEPNQE